MIAGRIPEAFIQEILSRVDIVDLIHSRGVPIKKTGANHVACCPFHNEKTPSFSVNQTKQFYHCFGCGAHGDAINFLKEFDGLSFTDAIEQLALKVGLEVPQDMAGVQQQIIEQPLYQLMGQITDYYQQQLKKHPDAKVAIDYLKNRGLTGEIAKEYGIGFAPPGWDNVLSSFGQTPQAQETLQKVGLLIKNEQSKVWDRFRNRIMFPIRDRKGRVVGFGGRVLEKQEDGPKYLNSPETLLFHKSECLFGLYELLKRNHKITRAILVEGYMDVIALAQHGIGGAIATLGTSITEQHLKKLFHYTSEIVFCFDGDRAGKQAALKAMHIMLSLMQDGYDIKFVFLPEGQDPDSYIREQGAAAFRSLLSSGLPFSEYFFSTLVQQVEPRSIDSRAKFVKMAKPLLSKLSNGVFREMMFHKLSEMVSVDRNVVEGRAAAQAHPYSQRPNYQNGQVVQRWQKKANLAGMYSLPPAILAALLLIRQPEFLELLPEKIPFELINAEGISLLVETLGLLRQKPYLTSELIEEELAKKDSRWKVLPLNNPAIELLPKEGRQQAFVDVTRYLIAFASRQMSQHLLDSSKIRELSEEEKAQLKSLLNSGSS